MVDTKFQCVVIIKDTDLPSIPPAFLNRFEKYELSHSMLLEDVLHQLPVPVRELINSAYDMVIIVAAKRVHV